MILTGKEDMRVRKTISAIRSNFEEMLLEMPYEKISVKALCERALINKTTFYRYYPTMDDLLEEVLMEYARPYAELTRGMRYPDDIEVLIHTFMTYCTQQGPLFDAILSSGAYSKIMWKLMDNMSEERDHDVKIPEGWTEEEWQLYLTHVNMSQIRIYQKWVEDGRAIPVERMVAMTVRLVCDGARIRRK